MLRRLPIFLILALSPCSEIRASDWPQFLGPTRNGVYEGNDLAEQWPSNGPLVLWKKAVGHGFSGPVVADHKLILFHRRGDQENVDCLEKQTGKAVWGFAYATAYQDDFGFDDGPRATPCVAGGRVYTFGAAGMLHCLDAATGKKLWSVDIASDFQAAKGFFGMACSPLVEGDEVLLNIGGQKGAGIVAFDQSSGKLRWKATDDDASYSSPIAATLGGRRYGLFLTRNGFVALDPITGGIRFQYPWHSRSRTSVNAATPLVVGEEVFLSACYGTGAILLRLHDKEVEKVWSGDDLLSNHYATSVERDGFLYGIHGRTDPGYNPHAMLRCVDLKKQKVCWETDSIRAATITRAGDRLLILTEDGELVDVAAASEKFQARARHQILPATVRAFPALADGCLYARNKDTLIALDLRKSGDK